jgi:uncharacterized protein YaaW (UPF0174 family)
LVLLYPFAEMLGNSQRSCLQSTTAHVTVSKINDSNPVFLKQTKTIAILIAMPPQAATVQVQHQIGRTVLNKR